MTQTATRSEAAVNNKTPVGAKLVIYIIFICVSISQNGCVPDQTIVLPTSRPTSTPSPTRAAWYRLATPAPTPAPPPAATPEPACPLPALAFNQHLSASGSYTQTETDAAGAMACRIQRNSCAFYGMVGILDASIVFKQEEEPPFDKEDILIHPAMMLPLSRLSQLVQAEWQGAVRLRVTDAYDSLLEHDLAQSDENRKYSLHFEGRSVDLTTWPIDRAKYGRLCALAACAGFDWVHNEGDHCHASFKAESLCEKCGN